MLGIHKRKFIGVTIYQWLFAIIGAGGLIYVYNSYRNKAISHEPFKAPSNFKPKLRSYDFIVTAFRILEPYKSCFSEIKFKGKNEMDFIFNHLSGNTTESNDLNYVFDTLIEMLRNKYFNKKTIKTPELFCGVLLRKILDEELEGKTFTIDDFLESKFIKNFCLIFQSDNSYGLFPFLLSENSHLFITVTEDHFKIEINEKSFKNDAKCVHVPNYIIFTFSNEDFNKGDYGINFKRILKRKTIVPLKIVSSSKKKKLISRFDLSMFTCLNTSSKYYQAVCYDDKELTLYENNRKCKVDESTLRFYPRTIIFKKNKN